MNKSYKIYDYVEDNTLITRTEQIKDYLDERLKMIDLEIDEEEITESVKVAINSVIDETLKESLETNIKETVTESLSTVNEQFSQVNKQIDDVKTDVINKVEEQKEILNTLATKEDVIEATNKINDHTTNSFSEIDFNAKFSDLNEQIKNLAVKADSDIINVLSELTDIDRNKFTDGIDSGIDLTNISVGGETY